MALVGSYVGLSKLLVAVFPVFLLAWLRFGIAAVAMAHWVRRAPRRRAAVARTTAGCCSGRASSATSCSRSACCSAWRCTSAVAAGVIMAAIPAAVALLSRIFLGERIRGRVAAAIGCAVAGIALLALAQGGAMPPAARGHRSGATCCCSAP